MYWHVTQVFTVWKTYEAFFWDLLNIWNMYWTLLEDYVEVSYVDQYSILRVEERVECVLVYNQNS